MNRGSLSRTQKRGQEPFSFPYWFGVLFRRVATGDLINIDGTETDYPVSRSPLNALIDAGVTAQGLNPIKIVSLFWRAFFTTIAALQGFENFWPLPVYSRDETHDKRR